jgi:hypothetical protein
MYCIYNKSNYLSDVHNSSYLGHMDYLEKEYAHRLSSAVVYGLTKRGLMKREGGGKSNEVGITVENEVEIEEDVTRF